MKNCTPVSERESILKRREDDGSVWEFYISSYDRPCAAAYSLLALAPSLQGPAAPEGAKR